MKNTCETCTHNNKTVDQYPCSHCCNQYVSQYEPKKESEDKNK